MLLRRLEQFSAFFEQGRVRAVAARGLRSILPIADDLVEQPDPRYELSSPCLFESLFAIQVVPPRDPNEAGGTTRQRMCLGQAAGASRRYRDRDPHPRPDVRAVPWYVTG